MADLVLRARIDLVRRNLRVVQCVLTMIEDRFPRVPHPLPVEVKELLSTSREKLLDVQREIDRFADEATMATLQAVWNSLRQAQTALFPTTPPMTAYSGVLPESHDLQGDLVDKAAQGAEALDKLEARIGLEPATALWTEYHLIELDSQKIFSEYVDLVRGVALRSSGLDQDLCRIADGLVRSISPNWRSITVPSRLERMAPSLAGIIRLGFPEWTVWSVPLAVHEYGHVFTEVVPELHQLLDGQDAAEQVRIETLMADAFAALTVGPAYGCAAVLTRLDPGAPQRGDADADHVAHRASMIIAALAAGNPTDEADAMIDRLRTEWISAVRETDYGGDPLEPHARTDELIVAVNKFCTGRRFLYNRWPDFVSTRANDLLVASAQEGVSVAADKPFDVDIRHLLNAAWLCRVPPSIAADRIATDGAQLGRIAAEVSRIGLSWLDGGGSSGGGGGGAGDRTPPASRHLRDARSERVR